MLLAATVLLPVCLSAGGGSSGCAAPVRPFDASDLGSLPLLSAVIKEGLRLLPPTPLGGVRVCTTDDAELCGYQVPKVGAVGRGRGANANGHRGQ